MIKKIICFLFLSLTFGGIKIGINVSEFDEDIIGAYKQHESYSLGYETEHINSKFGLGFEYLYPVQFKHDFVSDAEISLFSLYAKYQLFKIETSENNQISLTLKLGYSDLDIDNANLMDPNTMLFTNGVVNSEGGVLYGIEFGYEKLSLAYTVHLCNLNDEQISYDTSHFKKIGLFYNFNN